MKVRALASLAAVALACVLCARVQAADKPSCKELNALWADRYHRDFKVEWELESFQCPTFRSDTARAMHDLYLADPDHGFYKTAARLTKIGTRYSADCPRDTIAWMSQDGELTLCELFYKVSSEKRASTIFHEASHAREKDPKHVECEHGDAEKKIACDASLVGTYENASGYNWEVLYLRYVKNNSELNDITRWVAEGQLKFLLNNRFNRITAEQIKTWSRY